MEVEGDLMRNLSVSGFNKKTAIPLSSSLEKKKKFAYYQSFDTILKYIQMIILIIPKVLIRYQRQSKSVNSFHWSIEKHISSFQNNGVN